MPAFQHRAAGQKPERGISTIPMSASGRRLTTVIILAQVQASVPATMNAASKTVMGNGDLGKAAEPMTETASR